MNNLLSKISNYKAFVLLLLFTTGFLNGQTVKLKIIETSDVHGAIFPYNFVNDETSNSSLSQVHTYVTAERAKDAGI